MINNFRYSSSWEKFEEAVKIIKELFKTQKAYWLAGFMDDLGLAFDDAVYDIVKDIQSIVEQEILYLVYFCLIGREFSDKEIRKEISNAVGPINNISDTEINELVMLVQNKFELVKDALDIDKLRVRYIMKKDSVNPKLADFKYNVMLQNLPNGNNVGCVLLNMACKKKLGDFGSKGIVELFEEREPTTEITFICDEDDIDYLISQLEDIKQKIKGCYDDDSSKKNG